MMEVQLVRSVSICVFKAKYDGSAIGETVSICVFKAKYDGSEIGEDCKHLCVQGEV